MSSGMTMGAYIVASIFFILSLGGLSSQQSAQRGNLYGIAGMSLAIAATLWGDPIADYDVIAVAMAVGGVIGGVLAARVQMTSMPELVAILHSLVGLAAVFVGFSTYMDQVQHAGVAKTIHDLEVYLGVLIGAVTFTGSVIAFGKLKGIIRSKPVTLPGRHLINLAILIACIILAYQFIRGDSMEAGLTPLFIMTILACIFGIHMVMAIGGADMPVVISMLNSYSGWAAAATGFMLSNDLLIVTGALVGSSGAILSYIMCRAMNRAFFSVMMGGFGGAASATESSYTEQGNAIAISASETGDLLGGIDSLVIVPGYGMAVAHAQHRVSELSKKLQQQKVKVSFAIHPVAGRMPGHMNVLLAEARVGYDIVYEMDEINQELADTDVVMVIGANDIVNPAAMDTPDSPIAGMPVIQVWEAKQVIVLKRSMASGYAGVENPLFFKENTRMLFGDAKESIEQILGAL